MIQVPLRLRYSPTTQRPVAAWLVPGTTPGEWLDEVVHWPGEQQAVRILPLASGTDRTRLIGALVIPAEPAATAPSSGCRPFGKTAEQVFVPAEALLEPPLADIEWNDLLPDPQALFVWLPSGELVRFDREDVLTILDLLTAPPETCTRWDRARNAPVYAPRLRSIASAEPLSSLIDMEQEWRQQIGPPRKVSELRPVPDEPPLHWTERLAGITARTRSLWHFVTSTFWGGVLAFLLLNILVFAGFALYHIFGHHPAAESVALSSPPPANSPLHPVTPLPEASPPAGRFFPAFDEDFRRKSLQNLIMLVALGLVIGSMWVAQPTVPRDGIFEWGPRAPGAGRQGSAWSAGFGVLRAGWNWFWRKVPGVGRLRSGTADESATGTSPGVAKSWRQQADERRRAREVQRLLHMLEHSPDDGLRYAIPFGGEVGRGEAPAGNELVARDFHVSTTVSAGGPVDYWNIDPTQRWELQKRYREQAERQTRAGNHRRAAYIYSHLLGDWVGAASALVIGRLFAEAAVIYRDRLNNPAEAARCLELAGQFDAALQLYEQHSMWLAAGDLAARLERLQDSRMYYRMAVETLVLSGDLRQAAEILETKLFDLDGALALLEESWPAHVNAATYLDTWFTLAARHHRHDLAQARIGRLSAESSVASALQVLPRLQRVVKQYPAAAVQQRASDTMLQLIGQHLRDSAAATARQLTSFLPSLTPEDRLLPRDCQRFVQRLRTIEPPQPPATTRKIPELQLRAQFRLSTRTILEPLIPCSHGWVALTQIEGSSPQELILASWNGEIRSLSLTADNADQLTFLAAVDEHRKQIWLHPSEGGFSLEWPGRADMWKVVTPAFLPKNWISVKPDAAGMTRVLSVDDDGNTWFSRYSASRGDGTTTAITSEKFFPMDAGSEVMWNNVSLYGLRCHMDWAILRDSCLAYFPTGEVVRGVLYDSDGVRLWSEGLPGFRVVCQGSNLNSVLLLQSEGLVFIENPPLPSSTRHTLTDWRTPAAAFLPGEMFVVVDDQRLGVFTVAEGKPVCETRHAAAAPIAVSSAGIGRISIVRADGSVEHWGFDRRAG